MRTLIVVDMQNDFVTGSLGTKEAVAILPRVREKIDSYLEKGERVIFTRDTHFDDYLTTNEGRHLPVVHCIRDTWGWEIEKTIDVPECEHVDKYSFGFDGWDGYEFDSVELVGLCTDVCVISNALIIKALNPEIDVFVDPACCAGVTPELHEAALTSMRSCQIQMASEG